VTMNNTVFWDVTPHSLVDIYRCTLESCCPHFCYPPKIVFRQFDLIFDYDTSMLNRLLVDMWLLPRLASRHDEQLQTD
jgi:hypothetical protein